MSNFRVDKKFPVTGKNIERFQLLNLLAKHKDENTTLDKRTLHGKMFRAIARPPWKEGPEGAAIDFELIRATGKIGFAMAMESFTAKITTRQADEWITFLETGVKAEEFDTTRHVLLLLEQFKAISAGREPELDEDEKEEAPALSVVPPIADQIPEVRF